MKRGSNQPAQPEDPVLNLFELPAGLVRPAVEACRLFNTAVDQIFYDVRNFRDELGRLDRALAERNEERPAPIASFGAIRDPEGSLLLINAATPPYVRQFHDVEAYLDSPLPEARQVAVVSITGVGSSALGSAAFAWDISKALSQPVLAIVPGYGVADMTLQGLGGWFGFGLFDFLNLKSVTQNALANVAPNAAKIGRKLSASVPEAKTLHGAPVFRYGSGSSDVLHALMSDSERSPRFKTVIGHSKGALQIGNALGSLDPARTQGLHVVTLGCPIAEDVPGASYHQYLGIFDALGQLNMWGNWPDHWVRTWHTTNPDLPPAMAAGPLTRESS